MKDFNLEELEMIYSYPLDRNIVKKCMEEDRKLTNEDVNIWVQKLLEENRIKYKNRFNERWIGSKSAKYILEIEVYVNRKDVVEATKLIKGLY